MSGVLPVALAKATRVVQALLTAGKEYVTLMHLHKPVSEEEIRQAFNKFHGKIKQLPPVRSAVKRQERVREIYYFDVTEIRGQDVLFRVGCEAGTYIRKLVHDLGKSIGTGAHMTQLVRTKAGPFTDRGWHSLQDVRDAYEFYKEGDEKQIREVVLPYEGAVDHLPKIWAFDNAVNNLCHGSSLGVQGVSKLHSGVEKGDVVAVMTLKDELIGMGNAVMTSDEMVASEKGLCVTIDKVFMERNIYVTDK